MGRIHNEQKEDKEKGTRTQEYIWTEKAHNVESKRREFRREKLFEKRKKDQKSRRKGTNYRKVTQRVRTKLKDIKEGGESTCQENRDLAEM